MSGSDPQIKKQTSIIKNNEIQYNNDPLPPLCDLIKSPCDHEIYFQSIFENTGTAIVILDQDTSILHFNQKVQKITGYSKE
jgi:PAS domain-containing protein